MIKKLYPERVSVVAEISLSSDTANRLRAKGEIGLVEFLRGGSSRDGEKQTSSTSKLTQSPLISWTDRTRGHKEPEPGRNAMDARIFGSANSATSTPKKFHRAFLTRELLGLRAGPSADFLRKASRMKDCRTYRKGADHGQGKTRRRRD